MGGARYVVPSEDLSYGHPFVAYILVCSAEHESVINPTNGASLICPGKIVV